MASATRDLVFHFPVAASPNKIPILLNVLRFAEHPITDAEVLDLSAREQSTESNRFREARILAEQLGLIKKAKTEIVLMPQAESLLKVREAVQYDLLHFLFYTLWCPEEPTKHAKAWFYRAFCNNLWTQQDSILTKNTRDMLTEDIRNQALSDFQAVSNFKADALSIGPQTMQGSCKWLSYLEPGVLAGEEFHRRKTCSAELFLLALSRSYQLSASEVGVDVLLSSQRRDEICKTCLLEPSHFDRMLNWSISIFARFLSQGTRTGAYGRSVRLHRLVHVEDLA